MAVCSLSVGLLAAGSALSTTVVHADQQTGCPPDARLVNPCRPLFGAYSNTYPGLSGWRAQVDAEEQRIGRPLDIVHLYHPPGAAPPLNADEKYFATRPGTIMFSNWKPATKWADAAGGNAAVNAQIDQVADSIASVAPAKIMLTIHHEPEPDVSPGTSACSGLKGSFGSPADYRAMWRNIESRFAARGVTNVVWVMNYMSYQGWDCLLPELWPGNDLVDWVMFDPYNTGSSHSWSTSVGRFYNLLTAKSDSTHDFLSKPWGLAEFGIGGSTTQAQAYAYYDAARASVEANEFPRLKAYVAFDSEGTAHTRTSYSVAGALDAVEQQHFTSLANSPAFRQGDTTAPTLRLIRPQTGDSVQGDVPISATASDSIGVTDVSYALDGGPGISLTTGPDGSAAGTWDTTSATDGPHRPGGDRQRRSGEHLDRYGERHRRQRGHDTAQQSRTADGKGLNTDSADLTWGAATDDRGVARYRLTRDGTEVWSGAANRFVDTTVQPGTDYVYGVTALDEAGNSSPEPATLHVRTPETVDTVPPSTPELSRPGLRQRRATVLDRRQRRHRRGLLRGLPRWCRDRDASRLDQRLRRHSCRAGAFLRVRRTGPRPRGQRR